MKVKRKTRIASKSFQRIFWPTFLTAAANNVSVFVDSVIVSRFCGSQSLAAIQMTAPMESMISLFYWTVGIGGSLIAFEHIATNREEDANQYFTASILSILLIGMLIGFLCFFFCEPIMHILCRNAEVGILAEQYLRMLALCFVPASYLMGLSYFVRSDGHPSLPFWAIVVSNVVNLILDLFFIRVMHLGIYGAGLASLVGYIVGAIIISSYFRMKGRSLHFAFRSTAFGACLFASVKNGFPAASIQLYMLLKAGITNRIISDISTTAITAFSVFNSSMNIPFLIFVGVAQTMTPLISLFYHRRDYRSVHHVFKLAITVVVGFAGVFALAVFLKSEFLLDLFHISGAEARLETGMTLQKLCVAYIGTGSVFILIYYLQALKQLKISAVLSFLDGFAVCTLLLLIIPHFVGVDGIWISIAVSPFVSVIVYLLYAMRQKKGIFLLPPREASVIYEASSSGTGDLPGIVDMIAVELQNKMDEDRSQLAVKTIDQTYKNIASANHDSVMIDLLVYKSGEEIKLCFMDSGLAHDTADKADMLPDSTYLLEDVRISGINFKTIAL